jgi:hypothetical protein
LVAAITLAFLGNCGRLCASVGRQGAAYIIAFFEELKGNKLEKENAERALETVKTGVKAIKRQRDA